MAYWLLSALILPTWSLCSRSLHHPKLYIISTRPENFWQRTCITCLVNVTLFCPRSSILIGPLSDWLYLGDSHSILPLPLRPVLQWSSCISRFGRAKPLYFMLGYASRLHLMVLVQKCNLLTQEYSSMDKYKSKADVIIKSLWTTLTCQKETCSCQTSACLVGDKPRKRCWSVKKSTRLLTSSEYSPAHLRRTAKALSTSERRWAPSILYSSCRTAWRRLRWSTWKISATTRAASGFAWMITSHGSASHANVMEAIGGVMASCWNMGFDIGRVVFGSVDRSILKLCLIYPFSSLNSRKGWIDGRESGCWRGGSLENGWARRTGGDDVFVGVCAGE